MEAIVPPRQWKIIMFMAFTFIVGAPLLYLYLVFSPPVPLPKPVMIPPWIKYVALAYVGLVPVLMPVIRRGMISKIRQRTGDRRAVVSDATHMFVIQFCLAESPFVAGFLWSFVTGDNASLFYFYVVGAFWCVKFWPRKQAYVDFVQEAQAP